MYDIKNKISNIKINLLSAYLVFWKMIIIIFLIFSIVKFINEIDTEIHDDISYIKDNIKEQIDIVTEIFKDNSNSLINFIKNNKSNEEISKFLHSIKPRNNNVFVNTFLLIDYNLEFKASSYYSSEDQIKKYNEVLKTRKYVLDSTTECNNVKIGNVVNGITTSKSLIPFAMGLCSNNEYQGSILTGIIIEDLNRDTKRHTNIHHLSFDDYTESSVDITRWRLLSDILFSKSNIIKIVDKFPLIANNVVITYQKQIFVDKMKEFSIIHFWYLFISVTILYITRYVIEKEIIKPINKINNHLIKISDDYSYNHTDKKIELTNLDVFFNLLLSKIRSLLESSNQSRSALNFFLKDKINESKNTDKLGYNLFQNINTVQQFLNSNRLQYTNSNAILTEFTNSIKNFHQNLSIPNNEQIYNLYIRIEKIEEILDDIKEKTLDLNILNQELKLFNSALVNFYYSKSYSSFYIIHSQYFMNSRKLEKCNIKQNLIDIISNNDLDQYDIVLNIQNLNLQNFSICRKAFEYSFLYALKLLLNLYDDAKNSTIEVDFLSGDSYKSSILSITFSICNNLRKLKEPDANMLYSCKIFSALNSGKIMFNKKKRSLNIVYPFVNLD